nr:amino acid racemase [Candidatus Kapabacteria bacterium]
DVLSKKCENLSHSGAEFVVMASNTPHKVFKAVNEFCPVPMISIIEATKAEAVRRNVKKLCLLGTPFTMTETFYQDVFDGSGIELVVPSSADQAFIGKTLFEEIELGIINESTKKEYLNIIARVDEANRIDGVIMGCTELPMILKPEDIAGEYFDTLKIHVKEIVRECKK